MRADEVSEGLSAACGVRIQHGAVEDCDGPVRAVAAAHRNTVVVVCVVESTEPVTGICDSTALELKIF